MSSESSNPVQLLDLRGRTPDGFNLGESVSRSLRNGLPRKLPGNHVEDEQYGYTRSISTIALYSDEGLRIYEQITKLEEYYPFNAELEILEKYGDEIACRMFGLPTNVLAAQGQQKGRQDQGKDDKDDEETDYERGKPAETTPRKEKWGDDTVGKNNWGVNGSLNTDKPLQTGLAVELGSGSLDKTRHLLRSLSKLLQVQRSDGLAPLAHIDYKALDLEKQSLLTTLSSLARNETQSVSTSRQSRRVSISGIVATYDEGLEALRSQSKARSMSVVSESESSVPDVFSSSSSQTSGTSVDDESEPIKSLLWLGSSIGNMKRDEAASFLKALGAANLGQGDTLIIGIDNCNDGARIGKAYDDSHGVTRSFILEGVDNAGRAIDEPNLNQKNFDYVSRWNAHEGRHEAFIRCKVDGLTIKLPAVGDELQSETVTLKQGELIHVEESHKYTFDEAMSVFNAAGLRLIQYWQDSQKLHTIYALEKPAFFFPSNELQTRALIGAKGNTCGLPSMDDWQELWRSWDFLTREIIPPSLLLTKPIPLRHVILFYLGHIPGFADIHLSRALSLPLTEPKRFADIFERGIDPDVQDPSKINHSHSVVPEKEEDWPSVQEIDQYQSMVRQRIASVYDSDKVEMTRSLCRVMAMIFEHEAMHMETLVYIAVQACTSLQKPSSLCAPDFESLSRCWQDAVNSDKERYGKFAINATTVEVGHDDSDRIDENTLFDPEHRLGWDCENPKREVQVGSFSISKVPVENWQYLEWLTKQPSKDGLVPASWLVDSIDSTGVGIAIKTLAGAVPFKYAKYWPVAASAVQLEAYAKSIPGARLPTAAEVAAFQKAANSPVDTPVNNIGLVNLHPVPALTPHLLRDGSMGNATDGGVWLWTSDVLAPWQGYESSRLYPGYSSDFFDGQHLIIKGASYATIPRLARPSFCNWYQAAYPYVLAGARLAFD